MRLCSGDAFVPDRLGLRLASGATSGSSDFAHCWQSRQSHLAVSSLCCGRCLVAQSTDYLFTSSCSPPHLAVTQLLSVSGVSSTREGLSPSCAPSLPSARAPTFLPRELGSTERSRFFHRNANQQRNLT